MKRSSIFLFLLILCVGSVGFRAWASEDGETAIAEAGEVAVSGAGSLGELLADAITEKQESEEAARTQNSCIMGLVFSGTTAEVSFGSDTGAEVVVAVYDEVLRASLCPAV